MWTRSILLFCKEACKISRAVILNIYYNQNLKELLLPVNCKRYDFVKYYATLFTQSSELNIPVATLEQLESCTRIFTFI